MTETYQDAAQSLVDRAALSSGAFRKRETSWTKEGSSPDILKFAVKLTEELKRRGMPFFIHELYRGKERQNELHAKGNSKARFGSSPHNFGMAVDIVHYGRFWELSLKEWAIIGLIGKECARKANLKVTWGGDWSFYDPAHWELSDWKNRALGAPSDLGPDPDLTFAQAFTKARRQGANAFKWNGKLYSTELA